MNVGIIGSGAVAKTLGSGFLTHGHAVMLGTRDANNLTEWASKNPGAKVGSFADAARAIEPLCILWCIPGFLQNEWTHAFKVLHA